MADAPYLTAAQLKEDRERLADVEDVALLEKRVRQFEAIAERARGVAFTPRARTATVRYWRGSWVRLPDIKVRSITSATVDDVTVADLPLARITADRLGDLVAVPYSWPYPLFDVGPVITYEHGLDEVPEVILEACAEYVDAVTSALAAGTSRNVISQAFDGGTTRYSTPDWDAGRFTGWLEVDRLINSAKDYRPQGFG